HHWRRGNGPHESRMSTFRLPAVSAFAAFAFSLFSTTSPVAAAQCGGDFNAFIAAFSREAAAAGVNRATLTTALSGVSPDPAVLAIDRRQRGTFRKSFED